MSRAMLNWQLIARAVFESANTAEYPTSLVQMVTFCQTPKFETVRAEFDRIDGDKIRDSRRRHTDKRATGGRATQGQDRGGL